MRNGVPIMVDSDLGHANKEIDDFGLRGDVLCRVCAHTELLKAPHTQLARTHLDPHTAQNTQKFKSNT